MQYLVLLLVLFFVPTIYAIEESILKVQGTDSPAVVLEKLGAPKGASLPVQIKNQDNVISVEQSTPKMISIAFSPSHNFTVKDTDLFEKIDVREHTDRINHSLIIAEPKSGRIFHLNNELKVSKIELLSPWESKNKQLSLKAILNGMSSQKIEKKK